jgi:hypothetical protein
MRPLREYDEVRVVKLLTSDRYFSGTEGVCRPPEVGDVATVCHEPSPKDQTAEVIVEMVDERGNTIWLAHFEREELELVGPS